MRTRLVLVVVLLAAFLIGSLPLAPTPLAWSAPVRAQSSAGTSWWSSPDEAAMQVLSIRTETVTVGTKKRSALTGAAAELRIVILFKGQRRELVGYEAVAYLLVRDYLSVTKVKGRTRLVATNKLAAWTKAHPMTGGTTATVAPPTSATAGTPATAPSAGPRWELAAVYQGFQTPAHRSTYLGGNNLISPSASASGGEVTMSYWASSNCLQTVKYSWSFDRSLSVLRKGDKVSVRFKAEYTAGDCNDRRFAVVGLTGGTQFESVPDDVWKSQALFFGGNPEGVGVASGAEQNSGDRQFEVGADPSKAGTYAFFNLVAGVPVNGSPYYVAYWFRAAGV